jgi:small-conductance mechanosensitive channel
LRRRLLVVAFAFGCGGALSAQTPPPGQGQPLPSVLGAIAPEPSGASATLTYFNRPIVVLRARVVGRTPAERAAGATRILHELVERSTTGPVDTRFFEGGALITVAGTAVLALTSPDVDPLAGETIEGVAGQAATHLRLALDEYSEVHTPRRILRSGLIALAGMALGIAVLWIVHRARLALDAQLVALTAKAVEKAKLARLDLLRSTKLIDAERGLLTVVTAVTELLVVYSIVAFVLRRFPFTRPWGESMNGFLINTVETLVLGVLDAIPGLFTVALIFIFARFLTRVVALWFRAIEAGRVKVRWLYPETIPPTRRLMTAVVWVFAVVVSYPYLPGSQSEAFKGISVLIGLMVTIGSSGFVNQIMGGFMLTYARALRLGDFVRIGEIEGTVIHLGTLSTKIRTPWAEEVTVPNAVVVSQTTIDYSRFADDVLTPTTVTIGYDAPWRQVESLLREAAERTDGVRKDPRPRVFQMGLEDFYVRYTLVVCLERQHHKPQILNALHANIQDLFNEYGVQIMSPNYVLDPAAPKIVAKKDWFAPPAAPGAESAT